jgi:hypothetical protein
LIKKTKTIDKCIDKYIHWPFHKIIEWQIESRTEKIWLTKKTLRPRFTHKFISGKNKHLPYNSLKMKKKKCCQVTWFSVHEWVSQAAAALSSVNIPYSLEVSSKKEG